VLAEGQSRQSRLQVLPVSLAAMGVVFGDIGTSPLYTIKVKIDPLPSTKIHKQIKSLCFKTIFLLYLSTTVQ